MEILSIYGQNERKKTKAENQALAQKVNHSRFWKKHFQERFPELNTGEVFAMLGNATKGKCDDLGIKKALEIFVAELEESRPEWYTKKHISG